jgi:protein-disulfide isomerase
MQKEPSRGVRLILITGLLVQGFAWTGSRSDDLSKLKEVDFTGMSEAQKKTAVRVMGQQNCNCGCSMTIATCREKDSSCRRSLIFARTINDALREGKTEDDVVRVLKAKADTFIEARMPDDGDAFYNIEVGNSPVRGPKNAPIVIVEFSDFQCPYCARIQTELDKVLRAFPTDVRLVYKHFPLNIHQYARQAAHASMVAHAQGKFWQMHDKMFQNFSSINEENIKKWAREIGMNMKEFEKAMQLGTHEMAIQKDVSDGAAARVLGTPTVFLNGKRVKYNTTEEAFGVFKKLIQDELAARKSTPPPARKAAATKTTTSGN